MEEKNIKKIAIGLIIVGLILIGFGCYKLFVEKPKDNKDSSPTPTPTPIENITNDEDYFEYDIEILATDSEEIKIAKSKLKGAFNLMLECKGEILSEEGIAEYFFYRDTLDNYNNKFYNIYSSKLDYKDVYIEEDIETEQEKTNLKFDNTTGIPRYVIKDNKVYNDTCTVGSGNYERLDKFIVDSKTDDIIKINYTIIGKDQYVDDSDEYEYGKANITMIKENGDWKILKATIVNNCNGVYEVGKES